eukprot:TRINITY_DN9521_c0_g1_i1.p1 TRINITY_DN9521_c0_g1~~TRINITY_DN9521_c0_g1_i1.p1  ORF type:complete len:258 (+),score=47.59 TRINITY_DN9521_c0_g1_i1:1390-2163(+)
MTIATLKGHLREYKKPVSGTSTVLKDRLKSAIIEKYNVNCPVKQKEGKEEMCLEKFSLMELVLCYGSKIAVALHTLQKLWKKNPSAKVIIFSKDPKVLKKMGTLLLANHIPSVVVEGNVYRRNKSITSFSEKVNVILLGLDTAASGTNLTQATHVVLMDPVFGSAKQVKATEAQAIARAYRQGQTKNVTIVRLIVENSIEYETYLQVYGEGNKIAEDEFVRSGEGKLIRPQPSFQVSVGTASVITKHLNRNRGRTFF